MRLQLRASRFACPHACLLRGVYTVGHEITFVFGRNRLALGIDNLPNPLVNFGADHDFPCDGAGTIPRRAIHSIAYHRKLHAVRGPDESMNDFAGVNSDAEFTYL